MIKLNCLKSSIKLQNQDTCFGRALSSWELEKQPEHWMSESRNHSLAADWDASSSRSQADFYAKMAFLMLEFRLKLLIMLMLARYLMIPHLLLLVVLSLKDANH